MSDFISDIGKSSGGRSTQPFRTPRDVMADRRAREARKEAELHRQREEAQSSTGNDRRRSQRVPEAEPMMTSARSPDDVPANITMRQRSQSQSGSQPPKPQHQPSHRRSQTTQTGGRVSSAPNPPQTEIPQRATHSSFPHAFERWEDLSSHWEGLTSYWLRKIEANTEEIRDTVPTLPGMQRQIHDLSAAGANLFHGLVELQRLRASSERKFQRWFHEMKQEQERNAEARATLEAELAKERNLREEAWALTEQARIDVRRSEQAANERQRELNISKAEARRAWESLGVMEASQHEWIGNLRQGLPTVIGGVQVVPMHAVSQQSSERRPQTSEGPQYQPPRAPQQQPQEQTYHEDEPSPTDTDPFIESSIKSSQQLHHEPDVQSLDPGAQPSYPAGSTPASTSTGRTAISPENQRRNLSPYGRPVFVTTSEALQSPTLTSRPGQTAVAGPSHGQPELFYQQPPGKVYLHSSSGGGRSVTPVDTPRRGDELRSQPSYSSVISEGTEYETDPHGNVRRDDQGRPIISHRPGNPHTRNESQSSDAYSLTSESPLDPSPYATHAPTTSAEAMSTFTISSDDLPTTYRSSGGTTAVEPADYEGAGYGDWDNLQSRHHHPTRLSDVLEEEDERSRTTGE